MYELLKKLNRYSTVERSVANAASSGICSRDQKILLNQKFEQLAYSIFNGKYMY